VNLLARVRADDAAAQELAGFLIVHHLDEAFVIMAGPGLGGAGEVCARRIRFETGIVGQFLGKADRGDFQLYLEVAAADGRFEGYAKPLMQNVEIGRTKAAERSVLRGLWEGVVDFATEALDNEQTDQVGARVPFSGKIENPDADIVATIVSVLRNAFVSAFARSLEGSVGVREVKEDLSKYSEPER